MSSLSRRVHLFLAFRAPLTFHACLVNQINQTNEINEIDGLNDINGRNDPNGSISRLLNEPDKPDQFQGQTFIERR
jgi:hypothetical protein